MPKKQKKTPTKKPAEESQSSDDGAPQLNTAPETQVSTTLLMNV